LKLDSPAELFLRIAEERIQIQELPPHEIRAGRLTFDASLADQKKASEKSSPKASKTAPALQKMPDKGSALVLGADRQKLDYSFAHCCKPIPGDDVFGFVTVSGGIKVHRSACPNATQLMSKYGYRVLKAEWDEGKSAKKTPRAQASLAFKGIDDVGLVNQITQIISSDMNVDMKRVSFESLDGIFEGKVDVLVQDTRHLGELIEKLRKVEGVHMVHRHDD
jgi:GTP pyrophosphokinase